MLQEIWEATAGHRDAYVGGFTRFYKKCELGM